MHGDGAIGLRRGIGVSALLLVATLVTGLLVRFGPLGLPAGVAKYGGSMLWALAIYWVVSAVAHRPVVAATVAGVLATGVEFFKLYRSPRVDAFRLTIPGVLLLGRYFSWWDIVAYWVAIAVGAVLDLWLRRRFEAERVLH